MPSNEVAPQSPQEFNSRRNDDAFLLAYQYSKTSTNKGANDRIAYALDREGASYSRNNPPFIYPGPGFVSAVQNKKQTIKRGYIRRLTEFYDRLKNNDTQVDNPSTLQNLRCNFQFNPSSITRSMQSNYDMQFFFNQEPSQLAQPIPGQAGFAFELLFNREAEVANQEYVGPDGKPIKSRGFKNILEESPDFFINNTYDPAWVTEIGVLADIMILDDIVGQGLAKDLLDSAVSGTFMFKQQDETSEKTKNTDNENKDDTDKKDEEAKAKWDKNRLAGFSANLGNKAFLTPLPVRILFSPWFMVEGFVLSYNVTFNKFTSKMIPTQAVVAVQMQALYVGFAQKTTFMTNMPELENKNGSKPDVPALGTSERDIYDQTVNGVRSFMSKAGHIQGSSGNLDLFSTFFNNAENTKEINCAALVSDSGTNFFRTATTGKSGGELTFTVRGKIEISWHSYVTNATNQRSINPTSATSPSGELLYMTGVPAAEAGTDYSIYGTSASPLVATLDEIPVFGLDIEALDNIVLVLGQIRDGQKFVVSLGEASQERGEKAIWKWNLVNQKRLPFKEDKFNIGLELTVTVHRFNDPTYDIELPQKVRGYWRGVRADAKTLFTNLTTSSSSYSNDRPGRIN